MLYTTALHLVAGIVSGSVFTVRMLLLLVGFVLLEGLLAALVLGSVGALATVADLAVIQIGYLAGVVGRGMLEQEAAARADRVR